MKVRTKSEARHYNLPQKDIQEASAYVRVLSLDNETVGEWLNETQRSNIWSRIKKLLKIK
jgi:hypothetical protein